MAWIQANWGEVAMILWIACEALNAIPSIKSNSVVELIINAIESLVKGQAKPPQ